MPGPSEYPPQFSDSSISGVLGDINDFSGPEEGGGEHRSAAFSQKATTIQERAGDGPVPTPVFITGIAGPKQPTHPGLRETMIAAAILRFVGQLPSNDPNVKAITKYTYRLMGKGSAKIVEYAKKNSS